MRADHAVEANLLKVCTALPQLCAQEILLGHSGLAPHQMIKRQLCYYYTIRPILLTQAIDVSLYGRHGYCTTRVAQHHFLS